MRVLAHTNAHKSMQILGIKEVPGIDIDEETGEN
jgi:hypothetical protein